MAGFFLRLMAMLAFAVIATSSSAQCPSAYADGCSPAPTANADTIQVPNFFTGYAQQNGQTYVSTPPWNVAGVNYPVGINASYAENLVNPATAPLPTGCSFVRGSNPYVTCGGTASRPLNNLTINGYDFSNVQLAIGYVTGTLTITNNKFFNGPAVDPLFWNVDISNASSANVVMDYNYIDGNGPGIPNGKLEAMVLDQSTGSLTFQYNALLNITNKGLYYGTDSSVNISYNYGEGLNFGGPAHSEFISGGPATATDTMSNEEIGYNTFLVDKTNGGGTANIYVSNGVDGGLVQTANVNNNVDVSNYDHNLPNPNPDNYTAITSSYLIEPAHQDFGDINFVDNYFDPNGSYGCIYPFFTTTTQTYSGNVDMIDGSTVSSGACDYSNGILPTGTGSIGGGGGSAVPEPSTWAMVLIAYFVFGYSMSRRPRHCGLASPRVATLLSATGETLRAGSLRRTERLVDGRHQSWPQRRAKQ
jgi:hypothetical protein